MGQPGRVEQKAHRDKAFGLGLYVTVACWQAYLGRVIGQDAESWHGCTATKGSCLVVGPEVLACESFGWLVGERCPNLGVRACSGAGVRVFRVARWREVSKSWREYAAVFRLALRREAGKGRRVWSQRLSHARVSTGLHTVKL